VVNGSGKEAVVAMFGPTDFLARDAWRGSPFRMGTTTAVTPTTLLVIQKNELLRVLHAEREFSEPLHCVHCWRTTSAVEEDLIDQLFNSSEKRLARALLLLAPVWGQDQPERVLAKVSQETAGGAWWGTTRSRINFLS